MQGWLTNEELHAVIDTACAHCEAPMRLTVGSDGSYEVRERDASPLMFQPEIDWSTFDRPTIVDDF